MRESCDGVDEVAHEPTPVFRVSPRLVACEYNNAPLQFGRGSAEFCSRLARSDSEHCSQRRIVPTRLFQRGAVTRGRISQSVRVLSFGYVGVKDTHD